MKAAKMNLDALKTIDFSKVMAIVKRRGVMIGSIAVIVIVPLLAWFLRGGMIDSIRSSMNDRQKEYEKMGALEKTTVTIRAIGGEPESKTVVLNPTLIKAIKERNESLEGEFRSQYTAFLEHNLRGHDFAPAHGNVVLFPKPAANLVLDECYLGYKNNDGKDLGTGINFAFDQLLRDHRVGQPPTAVDVLESVQKRELAFIQNNLKKSSRSEVTDANDLKDLSAALLEARIATLQERAKEISFYLDSNAVRMPPLEGKISLPQCFIWQWDLWVLQDIFAAIAKANEGVKDGVISAPVKRIISVRISPVAAKEAAPAVEGESKEESVPAEEPAPTGSTGATEGEAAAAEEVGGDEINPATEITPNYATSLTGLASCQLFDVRNAKVELIVATAELPRILNCFARQNFMTVVNLKWTPVNVFQAARSGYLYGTEPCSQVSMTLQSIWFRDWTTKRMPNELKKLLGTRGFQSPAAPTEEPKGDESPAPSEAPQP